jgi:hypothetical protein
MTVFNEFLNYGLGADIEFRLPLVMLIKLCWPMLGVDPECFM